MQELIKDFLNGKNVIPAMYRLLSILFSISITSVAFGYIFTTYPWFEFGEYGSIIKFLLQGYFIPPLIIFLFIHYGTSWLSKALFFYYGNKYFTAFYKSTMAYQLNQQEYNNIICMINKLPFVKFPVTLDSVIVLNMYYHFKNMPDQEKLEFNKSIEQKVKDFKKYFYLTFKFLIAFLIFSATSPLFNTFFFFLTLIVGLSLLVVFFAFYLAMDLTPVIIKKVDVEMQNIISEENKITPLVAF